MHHNFENKIDQNWFETKMRLVPSVSSPKLVACSWQHGRKCQFWDEIGNRPPLTCFFFWRFCYLLSTSNIPASSQRINSVEI